MSAVTPAPTEAPPRALDLGHSFMSFIVGTLVMVVVIAGVGIAGSTWLLVPAFLLFFGVTAWVFLIIHRLLDDHGDATD